MSIAIKIFTIPGGQKQITMPNNGERMMTPPYPPYCCRPVHLYVLPHPSLPAMLTLGRVHRKTPPLVPHSHQSLRSYDPVEKIVTPPPLWHVNDPRPHIVILTESTAARSYLPPDNPVSHPAPTRWDVSTESTIARSYLPPDDPVTQPAPTQRDIRTESDSLRMPTPLWAIKDPHPRTVVPTESTATPLPPPLYYLPPDDPVFQPAPTRWAVRTESNSCAKSGIGMPAPPQPRMVVPAESTAVPLLPPLYYLPPDNPMSQPAPTQWDIQTESDGLTRPGIGMPMPLWDVKDPQSRTVVPTESTAARLYLPLDNPVFQPAPTQRDVPTESIGALYLPPDDPMSQPAPTQWDIRTESDSLTRPGIGMPMPLWDDVRDPQSRTVDPTESTAVRSHLSLNDPASRSSRAGSPLKYLRQLFRQLRHGSGSNSILNTIVESPALVSTPHVPTYVLRAYSQHLLSADLVRA
ncbi:hypothetical protein OG21DRAFT_902090 [Imleria badia]|nr:hypothetical protein OG21DRAFT_902090 [Imleria badia]